MQLCSAFFNPLHNTTHYTGPQVARDMRLSITSAFREKITCIVPKREAKTEVIACYAVYGSLQLVTVIKN